MKEDCVRIASLAKAADFNTGEVKDCKLMIKEKAQEWTGVKDRTYP